MNILKPKKDRSEDYWDRRYRSGLSSGPGSVGASRAWKWSIIERHASPIDQVVDVGCGDLSFWEGRDCPSYLGIDISPTVIKSDIAKRPSWAFIAWPAERKLPVKGKIVLCLDLLFHVLDEASSKKIAENICCYSSEWVFVHNWAKNPLPDKTTDGVYQVFRPVDKGQFSDLGFECVEEVSAPLDVNPWSAMYIFKRSREQGS